MTKVEQLADNKVKLEIQVPEAEVDEALQKAYHKVVKKVQLPGFRKGRVPRPILEAKFGPEILYEDALDLIVPDAYDQAVEETKIEPIDQPQMDLVQMEKGKPLIFTAEVEVKPPVKLGEYKGIEITQEVEPITEAKVTAHLESLREKHARMVDDEEGVVDQGDRAVIDFTGYIDGEPFEGGSAEGYTLEVGSGSFIPGFEDQMLGMKVGEEKEIKVNFPGDYHQEDLQGKEAVFKVKVNEIKKKVLPELNDDFAQEVSDFDTLAEFRADLEKRMKETAEKNSRTDMENRLVEQVAEGTEVAVPEVLVQKELDRMLGEMDQFLRMQGMTLENYIQATGGSPDDLKEKNREEAVKRVQANLTLDAIIKAENIQATEEDIQEQVTKFAESYDQDPHKVREMFDQQGQTDVIRQEICFRKAIDFLVDNANLKKIEKVEEESGEAENNN